MSLQTMDHIGSHLACPDWAEEGSQFPEDYASGIWQIVPSLLVLFWITVCRGDFGRLGHGDIVDVFIPKPISGLSGIGIVTVSCGDTHTLALSGTGQLYSFGRNQNGQLGTGNDEDSLAPAHVEALKVSFCLSEPWTGRP